MQTVTDRLFRFGIRTIEFFSIAIFGLFSLVSFFWMSCYEDCSSVYLLLKHTPFWAYPFLLLAITFILKKAADFITVKEKRLHIFLYGVCTFIFLFCAIWTLFTKVIPASDQATVYYIAKDFARGNYGAVTSYGSYLACYPHQIGLLWYYELLFRIFHFTDYRILQGMNGFYIVIIVLMQYHILDKFFRNKRILVYYLGLACMLFPLFFYTPFVYGEVPSFAFLLTGVRLLLIWLESSNLKSRLPAGIFSLLFFALSVIVRKNTLIFIIALIITLFLHVLKERRPSRLPYIVLLGILSFGSLPLIQHSYEVKSGNSIDTSIPAVSFVVMGQQDSPYGPGWYNSYNLDTFIKEADYDHETAVAISRQNLSEILSDYREHPFSALRFLLRKVTCEWSSADFAALYSNHMPAGSRSPFWESFFSGTGYRVLLQFMSGYQWVIYFLLFAAILKLFKQKEKNPLHYLFFLTAIGGFLFYLAWEGSGRYVFPYFLLAMPLAAYGLDAYLSFSDTLFRRYSKSRRSFHVISPKISPVNKD